MEPFGQVMLSHLNTDFVQNKQHDEFYDCYLDAVSEFRLFTHKKSVTEVVGAINRNLNSSRARLDGLCVLRRLLQDCSTEVFEQHCVSWAGLLLTALQSHDQLVTWQVTCSTTTQLFRLAKSFPELSRELMSSVVPHVITCLLQATTERVSIAVRCLSDCLRCYPRTCAPFLNKIESMIVVLLDRTEEDIAEGAAECYSLLAGCGGAGTQGARHTELWSQLSNRVLGSLHATLNTLYDVLPHKVAAADIRRHKTQTELQLRYVSSSETGHCYHLQHRFYVLTRLLGHMLSEEFASVVRLPVRDILDVICRVLAVTPKMLVTNVGKEMVTLAAILPSLHVSGLKLLTALIECATDVLLPHTPVINRLTTQTLAWSVSDPGHTRLFGRVRQQVYDTLVTWLQELGTSSDMETVCDMLLPHILTDCSPQTPIVMRQEKKDELKEPVSKKRRRHTEGATQLHSHHQVEPSAHSGVCLGALQVLHQLLISTGHFMHLKHHKKIHETVVPLLFKVTQQAPQVSLAPYSSAPCRQALYRVLLSCVLVPRPNHPAPTQCALRLFTAGANDPNIQVACFCREALVICSSIVHPRGPSFFKPVTTETVITTTKEHSNSDEVLWKHSGLVNYAGDATSYGGDRNKPEQLVQQLNVSVLETQVDIIASCDGTDVSMMSPNTSGDMSSVNVNPSLILGHVCDNTLESEEVDEDEKPLPVATEQSVSMAMGCDVTEVSMATVMARGKENEGVGSEQRETAEREELEGKTEGSEETDLATASTSVSSPQEDNVEAMLGSFVDVQPDGSDTP